MDVSVSWQRYQHEREQAKQKGAAPPIPNLSVNTLQEMIERTKSR